MQKLSCSRAHISLLCFLLIFSCLSSKPVHVGSNYLMFILIDGFRWDYFNKSDLNGFESILKQGVQAEYSLPVFPSLSYPNYYTIMTGLYPENHGIMLNNMYNPDNGDTFTSTIPYWWEQAEPFWITATKAGLRVDMYSWPGCEVLINGVKPNSCIPYSKHLGTAEFTNNMATAVDKFAKNESDIAIVYCEQPDFYGHIFGPESSIVASIVRDIDVALKDLQNNIKKHDLQGKVNVVIMSDHGMSEKLHPTIPISKYLNINDVEKVAETGVVLGVYPKDGQLDKVYNQLNQMPNSRVYKKENLPEIFHYKNNIRTSPIVAVANPGYSLHAFAEKSVRSTPSVSAALVDVLINGYHGYVTDTVPEMRGIFLAFGPSFKKGAKIPPVKNQDAYNLLMNISGLEPLPNNGTWANVAVSLNNN